MDHSVQHPPFPLKLEKGFCYISNAIRKVICYEQLTSELDVAQEEKILVNLYVSGLNDPYC